MGQRIYLIDDDEAIRFSLTALLATMGWETQTYNSVQNFLESQPDMPALNGCLLLGPESLGSRFWKAGNKWDAPCQLS